MILCSICWTATTLPVSYGQRREYGAVEKRGGFPVYLVGMPCTYYGTEIGMTGENDPDCRKAFDWEESH